MTLRVQQHVHLENLDFCSIPISGDDTRVIGFNIDRTGQIWVLKDELYEEEIVTDPATGATEMVERKRRVGPVKADDDLQRTLELNLPQLYLGSIDKGVLTTAYPQDSADKTSVSTTQKEHSQEVMLSTLNQVQ